MVLQIFLSPKFWDVLRSKGRQKRSSEALWRVSGNTGSLQGKRWSLEDTSYQHFGLKLVQHSELFIFTNKNNYYILVIYFTNKNNYYFYYYFYCILSLRSNKQIREKQEIWNMEFEEHGPVKKEKWGPGITIHESFANFILLDALNHTASCGANKTFNSE